MKTGKRFICIILTVVLLLSSFAVYSFAEEASSDISAENAEVMTEADIPADPVSEEADTEQDIPAEAAETENEQPAVIPEDPEPLTEEISEVIPATTYVAEEYDAAVPDNNETAYRNRNIPEQEAETLTLTAPVISPDYARSIINGLYIQWTSVNGAESYLIYRKNGISGKYALIGTTADTLFIDETPQVGVIYYYAVCAYAADNNGTDVYSDLSNSVDGLYVPSPTPVSIQNHKDGIMFSWNKVNGASGYHVYRRKYGETEWVRFGYISGSNNTYYLDTTAADGVSYTYKVCAVIWADGIKYFSCSNGYKDIYRLACIYNIKVANASGGLNVTWSKVNNATYYQIYRRQVGSYSWVTIGYSESTSYFDKTANTSLQYYYTVVARNSTGRGNYIGPGTLSPVNVTDAAKNAMINKAQYYYSNTYWLIMVNCTTNRVGIFYWNNYNWQLVYYWQCSSGAASSPTCKGQYTINYKGYSFSGADNVNGAYTCYYYSSFNGAYLFHSTLFRYNTFNDVDARLGMNLSHGCVRLYINNAKWIYNNIPIGTKVVTY